MAVYKVPQDVEADDKLIGPFSFRQFIYLIIVAIAGAGAWGLSQLFIPLAIIPLPIMVFFAALALPLRKDQPMEAYLSAVVSFYFLKSRKRFWQPDGINSFVTVIPPKNSDRVLTKDFNEEEATRRLDYLAELVDTHGWAIRGVGGTPDTSISTDLYYESQQTKDMMDNSTPQAQAMTKQLQDKAASKKEAAAKTMQTAAKAQTKKSEPAATDDHVANDDQPADDTTPVVPPPAIDEILAKEAIATKKQVEAASRDALAYATALAEEVGAKRGVNTSVSTPDTDTMELTKQQAEVLSRQEDISIQTIANQAKRVADKNRALHEGEEVTISLH